MTKKLLIIKVPNEVELVIPIGSIVAVQHKPNKNNRVSIFCSANVNEPIAEFCSKDFDKIVGFMGNNKRVLKLEVNPDDEMEKEKEKKLNPYTIEPVG